MKALITGGLSVALGLAAAHVAAQDSPSRTTGSFQRVAPSSTGSGISRSRPVPIAESAITPASYAAPAQLPAEPLTSIRQPGPVFRGKGPELEGVHQLLPVGPGPANNSPGTVKSMGPVEVLRPVPNSGGTFVAPMPHGAMPPGMQTIPMQGVPMSPGYSPGTVIY